jgi:cell division septal protein FtsQ
MASVVLSLILPLLIIPINWNSNLQTSSLFSSIDFSPGNQSVRTLDKHFLPLVEQQGQPINILKGLLYIIFAIYGIGLILMTCRFVSKLISIHRLISQNSKKRDGNFWIVDLKDDIPPFSFFNYIFLSSSSKSLSTDDFQRIKEHEKVHSRQFHSFDIIFVEIVSVIFWFNPLFNYLKRTIQEVHEFIVDEQIAGYGEKKKEYAKLLLALASDSKGFNLYQGFSGKQINRRIIMITRNKSTQKQKVLIGLIIPIAAFLLLSFSYIRYSYGNVTSEKKDTVLSNKQLIVGEINWMGNTQYSNKKLDMALGLKRGDPFIQEDVERQIYESDFTSLYLDRGYCYFRFELATTENNGTVDLTISIFEGKKARIGEIYVKGNTVISTEDILKQIYIKSGDLFNKSKIVASERAIEAMYKISVNVQPSVIIEKDNQFPEYDVSDIVFEVTENGNVTSEPKKDTVLSNMQLIVGEINWQGNTQYSNKKLEKALGLKKGDTISLGDVERKSFVSDFYSLYLDHGYAYFRSEITTTEKNGTVDLTISIFEGEKTRIGEIFVNGNTVVSTEDILKQISIKPGDYFNRSKLVASARAIEAIYKPKSVNVRPSAKTELARKYDITDITFEVTE